MAKRWSPSQTARSRRSRGPRPTVPLAPRWSVLPAALALCLVAVTMLPSKTYADEQGDLEPVPPVLLLRDPDPGTEAEIMDLIANSFADRIKAPKARRQLIHRYHMWSVPALLRELTRGGANESGMWNSILTLAGQRDTHGPAPELRSVLRGLRGMLDAAEPYRKAFGALALGCWHHVEADTPDAPKMDPLRSDDAATLRRAMSDSLLRLTSLVHESHPHVRTASVLALAKRGGEASRRALRHGLAIVASTDKAANQDRWAAQIARGFLRHPQGAPFFAALTQDDALLRRSAALGLSVAMLSEGAAAWTGDQEAILGALAHLTIVKRDGPEVVFARGVCAWKNQVIPEWKKLYNIAVQPSSERLVAIAAAQALLFCGEGWFKKDVLKWAAGEGKFDALEPGVLAGFLLLAAQSGKPQGLKAAVEWLRNGNRDPKANDREWDVRIYAVIGLLRALTFGHFTTAEERQKIIEALEVGLTTMHKGICIRPALEAFLAEHKEKLLRDAFYRLPAESLRAFDDCFQCPYALLSRDLIDVCVHRVNAQVGLMFNFDSLRNMKPGDKTGTAQRMLRAYFNAYPYFRRLEFRLDRGARPTTPLPQAEGVILRYGDERDR